MANLFNLALFPALIAFAVSFAITPLIIKLGPRLGIIDDPKKSKHPKVIHTYPVPRGGGVACFFGITISALLFIPIDKHLSGILAGAALITLILIYDFLFNLLLPVFLLLQESESHS